jgi:hypothetical protein
MILIQIKITIVIMKSIDETHVEISKPTKY